MKISKSIHSGSSAAQSRSVGTTESGAPMKICECRGWTISWPQVDRALYLARLIHGKSFNVEIMKFCPWCGSELRLRKEEDDEIKGG